VHILTESSDFPNVIKPAVNKILRHAKNTMAYLAMAAGVLEGGLRGTNW
jgi:hypothetical protein